jgi:hypothetical protein
MRHDGPGLSPDRVRHVDDRGDEDRQQHLLGKYVLERSDDPRRRHRPEEPEREPGQPMPEPATYWLLGRGARPRRAGEKPAEASQILLVLSPEDGKGPFRRHEPAKPAPPVHDGDASAATARQLRGGELLVDLGPDGRDRFH